MNIELQSSKYFSESHATGKVKVPPAIQINDVDWTKGLTVICILCMMFGLWGLGTAAIGATSALEGPDRAAMYRASQHGYEALRMQQAVDKVNQQFRGPRLIYYALKFVISIGLIAGAGILLTKAPFARKMMLGILASAVAFHVIGAALSCAVFIGISGQIEESARGFVGSMTNASDVVNHFMSGVTFHTLIWIFVGLVVKAGVYVRMMLHLHQPISRAVFAEDPYPECDEMMATEMGIPAGA